MTNKLMLMILALMVLSIGTVSAQTLIAGKIYNADYSDTIAGATVTVTCNGNVQMTTSLSDGAYSVTYNETGDYNACNSGDSLTVSAVKDDLYGSKTGIIHDDAFADWDLAVVNVPLVPEFGLVAGFATIFGAAGILFIVRRN